MNTATRLAAYAGAVVLILTASACSAGVEDVPGLTPDGVSVDTSKDGDISIETDDGTGSFTGGAGGSLPDGFPVDQVPVVEGDVQSGIAMKNDAEEGYAAVIVTEQADHDAAVALLTAEGFTVEETFSGGGTETTQLKSPEWSALVSTSSIDPEMVTVSYTVRRAQAES